MSKDRDLVRRGKDSADVDDTASDADKKICNEKYDYADETIIRF